MEPITMGFILILGIAIGEENKKQDAVIESQAIQLEATIEQLNRLSVSHSSVAAREVTHHEMQQREINALVHQLTLEKD